MRKSVWIAASGASLALIGSLTACGSETSGEFTTAEGENAEYTIDKNTGETSMTITGDDGEATLRSGAEVPVTLPDGFSLFPGSKVVTNTVVKQPDGQGTMVMFEAQGTAAAVIGHYRKQAEIAGFAIEMEMNTSGTEMIGGTRKGDGSTFSITAIPGEDGPTTGQIIISSKQS